MSEYNEYFTAPSFAVVTIRDGKVRNVFGPFDSREEGQAFGCCQDCTFEVVRLTAPMQKKQPVTITFEHSPEKAQVVNALARELGVSWSEGFPAGDTFVLKGRLNRNEIHAFRTRFGQEPWFTLHV
ncbi:hypothetical protein [Microvirga calopogonii]|uniref:hypothetical protein n=1 Tax=Microvirga calopogonii TaxID=2078013 RepID=UPI000E0D1C2E|nr:hypothetical protein [Microvirga calopogonii]